MSEIEYQARFFRIVAQREVLERKAIVLDNGREIVLCNLTENVIYTKELLARKLRITKDIDYYLKLLTRSGIIVPMLTETTQPRPPSMDDLR